MSAAASSLNSVVEQLRVAPPLPSDPSKFTETLIYRNRTNYGVNLGSLFVLESWIYNDISEEDNKHLSNEFDIIKASIDKIGVDATANRLYDHYSNYINSIDWDFLKNVANVNSLRVPVGYWHVNNGDMCNDINLPFTEIKNVYHLARPWDWLRNLFSIANNHKIGILVDLHALPGGANTDDHSGFKNKSPDFFKNENFQDFIIKEVLPAMVHDLSFSFRNLIGLQIINESVFDDNAIQQKLYYANAALNITRIDPILPLIISDGWWPQQFADWINSSKKLTSFFIVDTHMYHCFSDKDKMKDPHTIVNELKESSVLPSDKADFMIGEYSCVLDTQTWGKFNSNDISKDDIIKKFGNEQVSNFNKYAHFGSFFWTLKFQYGDGGEWGFVPMINQGKIPKRNLNAVLRITEQDVKDKIDQHVNYWADKNGDKMEHWRFEQGINEAINDCKGFISFDNSMLGRPVFWKLKRREQHIQQYKDSEFIWEWENGYQQGLDLCYNNFY